VSGLCLFLTGVVLACHRGRAALWDAVVNEDVNIVGKLLMNENTYIEESCDKGLLSLDKETISYCFCYVMIS